MLTYHNQVDGGDVVVLWSHWQGWLEDGAQGQLVGDGVVRVEHDVFFGKISRPEGGEGLS